MEMIKIKFQLGQHVRVVNDEKSGWFIGCKGIISYMGKKDDKNIYGLQLTEPNDLMDIIDLDLIYYFYEDELESIDDINITYTFI